MGLPVLIYNFQLFCLSLFGLFLLVVFLVITRNDVELFLVVIYQVFLTLLRKLQITIFKIELWKFLVVYHVIGVPDRS